MEVQASPKLIFPHPFDVVRESLATLAGVDGVSAGQSPVTVRVLTKKNTFINLGLVEIDKDTCELIKNNNSFEVTDQQLQDAYDAILGHTANGRS